MTETSEQEPDNARAQILATFDLAGEVVETCDLAARVLGEHPAIGGVVMVRDDVSEIIVGALSSGAKLLREALDGAREHLAAIDTKGMS